MLVARITVEIPDSALGGDPTTALDTYADALHAVWASMQMGWPRNKSNETFTVLHDGRYTNEQLQAKWEERGKAAPWKSGA